jgi:tetratricopeptide (TPR) repeat protein
MKKRDLKENKMIWLISRYSLIFGLLIFTFIICPVTAGATNNDIIENLKNSYARAIVKDMHPIRAGSVHKLIKQVKETIKEDTTSPQIPDLLFILASCYEQLYQFREAKTYYDEIVHEFPHSKYRKAAQYKVSLIKKSLEDNYTDNDLLDMMKMYVEQERLLKLRRYEAAIEKCRELLQKYKSSTLADNVQNIIAYVYFNYLEDYSRAQREYQRLLSLYPKSAFRDNAQFGIGRCCEKLKLYQSALVIYQNLTQKHGTLNYPNPDYWSRVWFTRAQEQLKKVLSLMKSEKSTPYIEKQFEPVVTELMIYSKRGYGDKTPHDLRDWIRPQETSSLSNSIEKIKDDISVLSFIDPEKTRILHIWNYVLQEYDFRDITGLNFWQYPNETIKIKAGDCYDLSFFLGSLLIAEGISRDNIRIMLGEDIAGGKHAWVNVKYKGEWYVLETTWRYGAQHELFPAKHEGYIPVYSFNDKIIEKAPNHPEYSLNAEL